MIGEKRGYALLAAAVFAAEVLIALTLDDAWVRPLVGDALAVILVYLALRAATTLRVMPAALLALLIAIAIELGQFFALLAALGLERNPFARVILGSTYDPRDFLAYALGAGLALAGEAARRIALAERQC